MLSIVHALNKWHQYLLGRKFSIRTNDNNHLFLLQQEKLPTEQQKQMERLSTFDMEMSHKIGKHNVVADTLSRKDKDITTCASFIVVPDWLDEIWIEYAKDPYSCSIIENIDQHPNFEWENDILWYKGRRSLIPSKFKMKVLRETHSSPTAGHVGFFKTCN